MAKKVTTRITTQSTTKGKDTVTRSLTTQVDKMILNNEKRLTALMRMSVQDMIDDANTPTAKGGKMRVDTGFLRASGKLSFTGMPTGPTRGEKGQSYVYNETAHVIKLGEYKLGMTIFYGWTANYAKYREAYDGFMASAQKKWKSFVQKNAAEIMKRIK